MAVANNSAVTLEGELAPRVLRLIALAKLLQFQPRHASVRAALYHYGKEAMTIYRIKSKVLREQGHKFETVDYESATRRLKGLLKQDPSAKILTIGGKR